MSGNGLAEACGEASAFSAQRPGHAAADGLPRKPVQAVAAADPASHPARRRRGQPGQDAGGCRVAAVRWGDWESVRSVFDAVTVGKIDHWVTRPVQTPAEEFHRSITEFLGEWSSQRGGGFEAVRVIGGRWSARSQELRDLFARYRVPAGL